MGLLILQRGVLIFEGGEVFCVFLRRVSVVILAQGSCPLQRFPNEDETNSLIQVSSGRESILMQIKMF